MELNAIRREMASEHSALQQARLAWGSHLQQSGPPCGRVSQPWEAVDEAMKRAERTGTFLYSHRELDDVAAVHLTQYLRNDCHAQVVNISSLRGWRECALAVATAIRQGLRHTQVLILDGNDLNSSPEVLDAYCEAFRMHPGFQRVSLQETGLDDASAMFFAEALRGHCGMHSVDLSRNQIGDAGVLALVDAVQENEVIVELGLNRTCAGGVARSRLMSELEANRSRIETHALKQEYCDPQDRFGTQNNGLVF